jgi:hypothetical protein
VGGEETSRWVYSKMGRGELNEAEERRDYYQKKINRYLFIGPCVSQNNFGQK